MRVWVYQNGIGVIRDVDDFVVTIAMLGHRESTETVAGVVEIRSPVCVCVRVCVCVWQMAPILTKRDQKTNHEEPKSTNTNQKEPPEWKIKGQNQLTFLVYRWVRLQDTDSSRECTPAMPLCMYIHTKQCSIALYVYRGTSLIWTQIGRDNFQTIYVPWLKCQHSLMKVSLSIYTHNELIRSHDGHVIFAPPTFFQQSLVHEREDATLPEWVAAIH